MDKGPAEVPRAPCLSLSRPAKSEPVRCPILLVLVLALAPMLHLTLLLLLCCCLLAPMPTLAWESAAASVDAAGTAAARQHLSALECWDDKPHSTNYVAGSTRFLTISRITEQLSKARHHLAEIMALAAEANRTLVLPHCGNSRVGSVLDYRLLLCTYFDTDALAAVVPWVSETYFYDVVLPQQLGGRERVSVFTIVMGKKSKRIPKGHSSLDCDPEEVFRMTGRSHLAPGAQLPNQQPLLPIPLGPFGTLHYFHRHHRLKVEKRNPRSSPSPSHVLCLTNCPPRRRGREARTVDSLVVHHADAAAAQVLVVLKGASYPCHSKAFAKKVQAAMAHVRYSPRLLLAVDAALAPYQQLLQEKQYVQGQQQPSPPAQLIGAHWRLEKALRGGLDGRGVTVCARRLINSVRKSQARIQLQWARGEGAAGSATQGNATQGRSALPAFFFASDIGPNGSEMSTTFHVVDKWRMQAGRSAIEHVYKELRPLTLPALVPGAAAADLGIQGILDKLILSRAAVLLTPPVACWGRHGRAEGKHGSSSFTNEICDMRDTWRANDARSGVRTVFGHLPCQAWR